MTTNNNSTEHNLRPVYRPDIDGLRAIAILSVVVFHAFPGIMRGGFVGVDIFFVISGYLISSIIFRSLNNSDFSFTEFYAHRVHRIFPALAVVLIAAYSIGWFILLPDEFKQLGKHIAAGAGYVQNFVLLGEAGYFDTATELKPLMHLWSLAIEEQFYIIFPLLIWGAWRLGINVFTVVIVIGLLSFVANISGIGKAAVKTFFVPQTRLWELLAGSALAYLSLLKREVHAEWLSRLVFHCYFSRTPYISAPRKMTMNNLLSILGLTLILSAALGIHKGKAFPGWWALAPVAGAFLLILAGPHAVVNRKVLANKLMIFVGVISYPLYLWHWLVLSFAQIIEGEVPSLAVRSCAVVASFLLAWITYRFIEKPIRFGRKTWLQIVALVVLTSMIGYVGFYTYQRDGFAFRVERFAKISIAAGEWQYPGDLVQEEYSGVKYFAQYSKNSKTTLFVGDSNIEQYYPRIDELIKSYPVQTYSAIFKTGGGCFPVPAMKYNELHRHCEALMFDALDLVKKKPGIVNVVIGGQWNGYLSGGHGLAEKIGYGSDSYKASLSKLAALIRHLLDQKKNVYIILNIPNGQELDPKFIAQRRLENFPAVFRVREGGVDKAALDSRYGLIQADLARLAYKAGAKVIKPIDHLCSKKCDALDAEGNPIYKDSAHLRPSFVRKHVKFIDQTVQD